MKWTKGMIITSQPVFLIQEKQKDLQRREGGVCLTHHLQRKDLIPFYTLSLKEPLITRYEHRSGKQSHGETEWSKNTNQLLICLVIKPTWSKKQTSLQTSDRFCGAPETLSNWEMTLNSGGLNADSWTPSSPGGLFCSTKDQQLMQKWRPS